MKNTWVHRVAGIAATFHAQDQGRSVVVDYTTILGSLPHRRGEEPTWIVYVQGTEIESREEYSWGFEEYWSVTRNAEGTEVVDEASDEEIAQVTQKREVPKRK